MGNFQFHPWQRANGHFWLPTSRPRRDSENSAPPDQRLQPMRQTTRLRRWTGCGKMEMPVSGCLEVRGGTRDVRKIGCIRFRLPQNSWVRCAKANELRRWVNGSVRAMMASTAEGSETGVTFSFEGIQPGVGILFYFVFCCNWSAFVDMLKSLQ